MIVLRDSQQLTTGLTSPTTTLIMSVLAEALRKHFQALSDEGHYDPEEHGYIVIAEPGDELTTLEKEISCPILTDWFQQSQYGDENFVPAYEWLDDQLCCYEMGYTLNDNGFTVLLIVPKLTGIDKQLLTMCREQSQIPTG